MVVCLSVSTAKVRWPSQGVTCLTPKVRWYWFQLICNPDRWTDGWNSHGKQVAWSSHLVYIQLLSNDANHIWIWLADQVQILVVFLFLSFFFFSNQISKRLKHFGHKLTLTPLQTLTLTSQNIAIFNLKPCDNMQHIKSPYEQKQEKQHEIDYLTILLKPINIKCILFSFFKPFKGHLYKCFYRKCV